MNNLSWNKLDFFESEMKNNNTVIPFKIHWVRQRAVQVLKDQESYIHRDLAEAGRQHIEQLKQANNSWLRRLGILRPVEIPTLESVVQGWKAEWKENRLDWDHPAEQILRRIISSWWRRLQLFSKLPESQDDETMYLSVRDVELLTES